LVYGDVYHRVVSITILFGPRLAYNLGIPTQDSVYYTSTTQRGPTSMIRSYSVVVDRLSHIPHCGLCIRYDDWISSTIEDTANLIVDSDSPCVSTWEYISSMSYLSILTEL